jgi:YD repeat-containing protein
LKADTEETLTLYNYEDGYIWVLRLSDGTQEVYDFDLQVFTDEQRFSSKLLWSKQHGGVHHTYGYDAEDRLETITHSNGQQLRFFYNADDRIERVAAPGELSYSYRYDDVGNLIGVTYPGRASEAANDTASKTYLYEDPRHPHHLTGILDEGGQRFAHYAYDAEGRTVLSEHGDGGERVEVLAYGDNVRTRNALGKESVYHFGTAGSDAGMMRQLMSVEGEASASCAASNSRYRYDDNGFKDLIQGENGLYTDLDYNGQGQLIRRAGPLRMQGERLESLDETQVVETDWVAPPALNMPLERREPGKTTRYSYEHDRIATLTETDTTDHTLPYSTNGNTRSWTNRYTYYDVDGRRIETITIDGPLPGEQDSTQYAFDDLGNLSRQTNALGHVVSYSDYTPLGHPGRITDANGLVIELDYNALGLLRETRSLSQQGAATTRYAYYPNRQISRITLTDGSYLSFEYNAARHLTAIENDLGERIEYTPSPLDGQWRDQLVRAGDGAITRTRQRVFDELGRVIRLLGANTQRSDYQYDPAGNRIAETRQGEGAQAETLFAYDGLKRLTTLTDPLQSLVEFGYDPQGNLDALTDPLGNTTHYVYNGFGNLIQQTSPDTGVTTYTYDDAGNRISQTDARNITVSYEYDLLNRLTGIHYPDSALDRTYRYDEGVNGIGRLVGMSDAEGVSEYVYNDTGALVRQIRTSRDGITTRFEYVYDAQGRLVSQTYPSGYVLKFSYLQGRLSGLSLQRPDGAIQPITTHLKYLPFGPLQSLDYGNGLSLSRSFDQDYRLTNQVIQGLLESHYTYDPMDNLKQWEDLLDPDQDQHFDYDLLNRLTRATQGEDSGISYTYDALGNRLSRTTWTARGLMSATTVLPEYDAVGNAVRDARGSYRYDDTNRLVGFNSGDTEAGYGYNGRGERVRKTLDGEITRFRYGPSGELLGEYNESGQPIREYLYQDGQPVAMLSANQLVYLHTDHLGTVIKASDESGALVWSARRDPFGKRWISMAQVEMPLGYPGQYYDQESAATSTTTLGIMIRQQGGICSRIR